MKNTSSEPQASKDSFRLVKICDGLMKLKHDDYIEKPEFKTKIWSSG